MYQIHVVLSGPSANSATKEFQNKISQDDLYKMLGRYLCKWGNPVELETDNVSIRSYAFYQMHAKSFTNATISFCLASLLETPVVEVPPEVLNPKIQALLDAGVLTKAS